MKYRKLGASDLKVSEISLGSWLTYGVGVEARQGARLRRPGVRPRHQFHRHRQRLWPRRRRDACWARRWPKRPRDSYMLATKLFVPMSDTDQGLSRAQVFKQIDASLQRLRTDYVDLYQCHRYDPDTPLEETMQALSEIVRAGKVRWIGFSEWSPEQIEAAFAIPGVEQFVSSQPQYSLLWRRPEQKVIPLCAANGISQIVWSPLAQGVLTGKYDPSSPPPAGHPRHLRPDERRPCSAGWKSRCWRRCSKLKPIADEAGLTLGQFSLAWVLREPNVASAIVGASRPEQLDENAAASGAVVDPALFAKAEETGRGPAGRELITRASSTRRGAPTLQILENAHEIQPARPHRPVRLGNLPGRHDLRRQCRRRHAGRRSAALARTRSTPSSAAPSPPG